MTGQPVAVSLSDGRLVVAYEQLRSQAVEGWRQGPGPGLTLMLTRGLRCWMETSRHLLDDEATQRPGPHQPAQPLPSGLRSEVVRLLASMLLHRAWKGIA